MKKCTQWIGVWVYFWAASCFAAVSEESALRARLKSHFPELTVDEISPTDVAGLYQITSGGAVLYITKEGRFVFSGDMIDLENANRNVTEEARKANRVVALNAIGKENMIIFAPPHPKYTITVFTDIDCGYCRKLQSDMAEINKRGIAVQYLAFPRTGLDSPTGEKMVKIWCAKDKQKEFTLAKQGQPLEEEKSCENKSVTKGFELGVNLGITGTPTLVFEDGSVVPGYLPPDKLLAVAKQTHKK